MLNESAIIEPLVKECKKVDQKVFESVSDEERQSIYYNFEL